MQDDQLSSICKENAGRGGEALAAAVTLPWDPPFHKMILFWRKRGSRYLLVNSGKITMYRLTFERGEKAVHLVEIDVSEFDRNSNEQEAYLLKKASLLDMAHKGKYDIKQI